MRTLLLALAIVFLLAVMILAFAPPGALRDRWNRVKQRFYFWQFRMLADSLRATMVAATSVTVGDRPGGHHYAGTFILDIGNVGAVTGEVETVAIPGAQVGDCVIITPRSALNLGLGIVNARVTGPGAVEFIVLNVTAGALNPGAITFDYQIIRGTTGPLR